LSVELVLGQRAVVAQIGGTVIEYADSHADVAALACAPA
jgi:hypothetical protein